MSNPNRLNIIKFASNTLSLSSNGQSNATCMHTIASLVGRAIATLYSIDTICKLHIRANVVDTNDWDALKLNKVHA